MSRMWRIALEVPFQAVEALSDALSELSSAVTALEITPEKIWSLEAIAEDEPDRPAVVAALALAAATVGHKPPDLVIEPLPEVDWLALNRQSFPPLREGRVWIRGSHVEESPPAGTVELIVDAARAFGSGSHATTALCLLAIQDHLKRKVPRNALDLGCGSGILAMALAKLRPSSRILATDIDRVSVDTAAENFRLNRVSGRVRAAVSYGWRATDIAKQAPFDLVMANILADPLCQMAPDLASGLERGGTAILSGLLDHQERKVIAAHRQQKLQLCRRYRRDGWSALVFRKL